ncbi:MAG: hypothetical protein Kow0075_06950 [Salibacteraceae bacterium]
MKILYIEDDPVNAYVLKKMLSGFSVDVAESGQHGMEMAAGCDYDLILMDINLGEGERDGIYYMRQLRENGYSEKPIVAVTGYAAYGDRERFMDEGFDEYFSKPVEKLRLILFIEQHRASKNVK